MQENQQRQSYAKDQLHQLNEQALEMDRQSQFIQRRIRDYETMAQDCLKQQTQFTEVRDMVQQGVRQLTEVIQRSDPAVQAECIAEKTNMEGQIRFAEEQVRERVACRASFSVGWTRFAARFVRPAPLWRGPSSFFSARRCLGAVARISARFALTPGRARSLLSLPSSLLPSSLSISTDLDAAEASRCRAAAKDALRRGASASRTEHA